MGNDGCQAFALSQAPDKGGLMRRSTTLTFRCKNLSLLEVREHDQSYLSTCCQRQILSLGFYPKFHTRLAQLTVWVERGEN